MPGGDGTGPTRRRRMGAGHGIPDGARYSSGRAIGSGKRKARRDERNTYSAAGLTGWQRAAMGMPPAGREPQDDAANAKEHSAGQADKNAPQLEVLRKQESFFEEALKEIRRQIRELQPKANGE